MRRVWTALLVAHEVRKGEDRRFLSGREVSWGPKVYEEASWRDIQSMQFRGAAAQARSDDVHRSGGEQSVEGDILAARALERGAGELAARGSTGRLPRM